MNKRDVVLSVADASQPLAYIPAAFFLHFSPEFHAGQAAVDKHLEYFRVTGMDFVKIQYERTFPPVSGIQKPEDWARMLHYGRDFFEGQLAVVEGLVKAAKKEAVVVVTLYSSYMCAGHSTSDALLTDHLNRDPEQVKKGLEIITDSLLLFVRECIKLGVDGFYTSTQGGEAGRFSEPGIFEKYVKPFDLVLMNEANRTCPFNILHVCDYQRDYADFSPFLDYPGTVVNSPLKLGSRQLEPGEVAQMFRRPYMGGLERKGIITRGSPDQIRRAVDAVIAKAPERFILGADCTIPSETRWANLKTAIDAAHAHTPRPH
ncbi:MAG TPA: uroporphyrinogen decarboxylase family protein [Aggregatilineales bacterium]|nr:uroporphyrinogen decarboxylase family protein [Aggregatilineales bacterium]